MRSGGCLAIHGGNVGVRVPLTPTYGPPKIVDPYTPGLSYELPYPWTRWLQENAVPGSGRIIK